MALSDRFRLQVGDRVRDRQTQEEGRVLNIQTLLDDALLLTVGIFLGGKLIRQVQTRVARGQVGGEQWQKVGAAAETRVRNPSSQILSPAQGGEVSRSAVQKAAQNLPPDTKLSEPILREIRQAVRQRRLVIDQMQMEVHRRTQALQFTPRRDDMAPSLAAQRILLSDNDPAIRRLREVGAVEVERLTKRVEQLREQLPPHLRRQSVGKLVALMQQLEPGPATPRHGGPAFSPEDRLNQLSRRIDVLGRIETRIKNQKADIDAAFNYLTATYVPIEIDPAGRVTRWKNTYFTDRIRGFKPHHYQQILTQELGRTTIPAELRSVYGTLIPEDAKTVLDMLVHAEDKVSGLRGMAQRELWRRHAEAIGEVMRSSGRYQTLERRLGRVSLWRDLRLDRRRQLAGEWGFETRYSPHLDTSNFGRFGYTEEDLLRGWDPWFGETRPALRHWEIAKDLKRREAARLVRPGAPGLDVDRMVLGYDPQKFFRGPAPVGQIVMFRPGPEAGRGAAAPFAIHAVDAERRLLTLRPITTDLPLYTSTGLTDPARLAGLASLPVAPARAAQAVARVQSAQAALERASRLMETGEIRIAGGLTGRGTAPVPMRLLRSFLIGDIPATEAGVQALLGTTTLESLGFGNAQELRRAAGRMRGQFTSLLFDAIPEAELEQLKRVAQGDILSEAYALLLRQFPDLPQGLTMGEIQKRLAEGVGRQISQEVAHAKRRAQINPLANATSFSQLNLPSRLQEILEKNASHLNPDEVADLLARGRALPLDTGEGFQTAHEFALELREFKRRVARGESRVVAFQSIFGGDVEGDVLDQVLNRLGGVDTEGLDPDVVRRATFLRSKADQAISIAENIERFGLGDRYSRVPMQRLARQLGVEIVDVGPDAERAWRSYRQAVKEFGSRDPRTQAAAQQYTELRTQAVEAIQERRFRQKLGLDPTAPTTLPPTTNNLLLNAEARAEHASKLNALIRDAEETGDIARLRELGLDPIVGQQGDISLRMFTGPERTGRELLYRPVAQNAGVALDPKNPQIAVSFGNLDDVVLNEQELSAAMRGGRFRGITRNIPVEGRVPETMQSAAAVQQRILDETLREEAFARGVRVGDRTLPVIRTTGPTLGFAAEAPVDTAKVLARTAQFLRGTDPFIALDIETDIKTQRILNVTAREYRTEAGKVIPTGKNFDVATPEFWASKGTENFDPESYLARSQAVNAGHTLSPTERTIVKHGRAIEIGSVVRSEGEMLTGLSQFLQQFPEATIVGHNVAFDPVQLTRAAERLGMEAETKVFQAAADRVADTMLMAQAALPGAKSVGLENLGRQLLGETLPQAHVAGPDVDLAARLAGYFRERGQETADLLATAKQIKLGDQEFLWDYRTRRAYELVGVIDAEKAREIFQGTAGRELKNAGFAMALREVDWTRGTPTGPLSFVHDYAPHTFARSFEGRFEVMDAAAMAERMEQRSADLARRRVRRLLTDTNAFETLLKERERLGLAQAAAEGRLEEARLALLSRIDEATSSAQRNVLSSTYNWAEHLKDSRILRQLQHEHAFWAAEIEGAHKPVVDWLEQFVTTAAPGDTREAMAQANRVWTEYMRKVGDETPFALLENVYIPPGERRASIHVGLLGRNARGLRIGLPSTLESDFTQLTREIAGKLAAGDPESMARLFPSTDEFAAFTDQLKKRGAIDWTQYQALEEHIWQRYLRPAVAGNEAFGVTATSRADAVSQIVARSEAILKRQVVAMDDPLRPRTFDPARLAALQQEFLARSPVEVMHDLTGGGDLTAELRHGIPRSWVGHSFEELVEGAAGLTPGEQNRFAYQLRSAARTMAEGEATALRLILGKKAPSWIETVFPQVERAAAEGAESVIAEAGERAARKFAPGVLATAGLDAGEFAARNAAVLRGVGMAGLGLVGAGLALSAAIPPQGPKLSANEQAERDGIASTEQEEVRRRSRVLKEQSLFQKVRIRISGVDPAGIHQQELLDSVHSTLGEFFATGDPDSNISDGRSRVDGSFLETLAGMLLSPRR